MLVAYSSWKVGSIAEQYTCCCVAVVVVSLRLARSPPFCHGPFGKGAGFSSTKPFQFLAPNQLVLFGSELELVVIESNRCIVAKKS